MVKYHILLRSNKINLMINQEFVIIQVDVDKAVAAARAAFTRGSVWRKMDASARGEIIYKVIKKILIFLSLCIGL